MDNDAYRSDDGSGGRPPRSQCGTGFAVVFAHHGAERGALAGTEIDNGDEQHARAGGNAPRSRHNYLHS